MNNYKDYIIKEYPSWKIKLLFNSGIKSMVNGDTLKQKKINYNFFFNIEIETFIFYDILNKIQNTNNNDNIIINVTPEYEIKLFILNYIGACIPSFNKKWEYIKMNNLFPIKYISQ